MKEGVITKPSGGVGDEGMERGGKIGKKKLPAAAGGEEASSCNCTNLCTLMLEAYLRYESDLRC